MMEFSRDFSFLQTQGFIPENQYLPSKNLPTNYEEWEKLITQLSSLLKEHELCSTLDKMPILSMNDSLEEGHLERCSLILSYLSHGYAYEKTTYHNEELVHLPDCLTRPWAELKEKITWRKLPNTPTLTIYDAVLHNWQFTESYKANPKQIENIGLDDIEPIVHAFPGTIEKTFHLTILLMEIQTIPLIQSIISLSKAMKKNNEQQLIDNLKIMISSINNITNTLQLINLNSTSHSYLDPIDWCQSIALFTANTDKNKPGMSGMASPLFHLIDSFVGRKNAKEKTASIGQNYYYNLLKLNDQFFIKKVGELGSKIKEIKSTKIQSLLNTLIDVYASKDGLLNYHARKAEGVLNLMYLTSRKQTNMEQLSDNKKLREFLTKARYERLTNRGQTYFMASKTVLSKARNNAQELVEISFTLPGNHSVYKYNVCKISVPNSSQNTAQARLELSTIKEPLTIDTQKFESFFKRRGMNAHTEDILPHADIAAKLADNTALLKPLKARNYSIVACEYDSKLDATQFTIIMKPIVGGLASSYLTELANPSAWVRLKSYPRINRDLSQERSFIVFTSGTGLSVFMRDFSEFSQINLIVMCSFSYETDYKLYEKYINNFVKNNPNIEIRALFTKDKKILVKKAEVDYLREYSGRMNDYLQEEPVINFLSEKLNLNPFIFIVGNAGFSQTIQLSLKSLFRGVKGISATETENYFNQLIADNQMVIISSIQPKISTKNLISYKELSEHNNVK
ncbi:MAG: indoleamine 2,3-dioxygenase, partial [Silvanigrellaceae bacterium]|nr:indoleamine 2,3-dioxygenase [Silvanigrellaceae bacterium]